MTISKTMPDDFTQVSTSDLYELSQEITDEDLIIGNISGGGTATSAAGAWQSCGMRGGLLMRRG